MKFLVLGASGMAGHVISLYLKEQGHNVIGASRRKVNFVDSICLDVFNTEDLSRVVLSENFDIIINAIGILNNEAELNKYSAVFVNSFIPHYLAKISENLNTRIFQMSTDCVFLGNNGPYFEDSIPDGRTFYDRTKALGELNDKKNLTFRNSIVGPDMNKRGIGLFNWFAQQNGRVNGYLSAKWTGVTTVELAKAMEVAALEGTVGLVNLVPENNISKFDLLKLFNRIILNNKIEIVPTEVPVIDKTLVRSNFNFSYKVPNYEEQIVQMKNWIVRHRDLYTHYPLINC